MRNDWHKIESDKNVLRKKRAALPFGEKLRLLDRMRERALLFRNAKRIKQK